MTRTLGILSTAIFVLAGSGGCNVTSRWANNGFPAASMARLTSASADANVDLTVVDGHEVDLVEELLARRADYLTSLEQLNQYYIAHSHLRKAQWARAEMAGQRGAPHFRYLMDAEVASEALQPSDSIEEADAMYDQGIKLMRRGGHGVPVLFRADRMVEAAKVFRDMIRQYPSSDKIDDAAFFLGEIHKDYLRGQEEIAVSWYERAWTWNPQLTRPAMFNAATVLDYRLHDRDRALELYQRLVSRPGSDEANVRSAVRRIQELSGLARSMTPLLGR